MATVDGNARLARHVADIDDDGHHTGSGDSYEAHGNTGSTETFDAVTALWHSATLNANCTFTFTGATSGVVAEMILELLQDGTGSRIVTWPGSVVWPGGSAPTLTTTAGATDILLFESRDGGTTWFGYLTGAGSTVTYATPAIVLGTAAATGAAASVIRSDATIVAFDATAPVTQAFSDSAATGSATVAARRDHKHGMPASTTPTTHYEILMASGSADPLLTSDGLDYLYVEVPN